MKRNFFGKVLVFAVGMMFMAGCGETEVEPEVGSDWRTTGSYVYGTLEHGEKIDVLVGLGETKLTIFYDAPTKEAYMSLDYPYETTDLASTANSLVIEDLNEDGYTDLKILVFDQQGEQYEIEYLWDADAKSYTCIAPDPGSEGDFTFDNFLGGWTNESENVSIVIDTNHNWAFIADDAVNAVGEAVIDYGVVTLYTVEGTYYCTLTFSEGTLVDEYENVYTYAGPAVEFVPDGLIEVFE